VREVANRFLLHAASGKRGKQNSGNWTRIPSVYVIAIQQGRLGFFGPIFPNFCSSSRRNEMNFTFFKFVGAKSEPTLKKSQNCTELTLRFATLFSALCPII
jgi:hypothetical protein